MKKQIVFFLAFIFSISAFAQQYKTHAVKEGETLESIAKEYKVTPFDILKLNPEAKNGVKKNTILVIPVGGAAQVKTEEVKPQPTKITPVQEEQEVTFITYKVRAKETIYGIAKKYGVTVDDIKRYNKELYSRELKKGEKINIPRFSVVTKNTDVKTNVEQPKVTTIVDTLLQPVVNTPAVLPSGVVDSTKYDVKFELASVEIHKVRRKETIYSLSKQYNITVDDIKKYNKELYARGLKKGEKINIPVFKKVLVEKIELDPLKMEREIHIVKPKETRWGIANSYGLNIGQLKRLNPEMGEIIKIGDTLIIPKKENIKVASTENFIFYEVKPKETLYSLTREFKITNDSLQFYNPTLKDGLKAGMVLKLPKAKAKGLNIMNSLVVKKFTLIDSIKTTNHINIAYLIPFRLETIDFESRKDIVRNVEKSTTLNLALDFYTGALVALDSIKKLGLTVNVQVFDSEASEVIVTDIVSAYNFKKFDAVIGPFTTNAFNRLSVDTKKDSIPVFSPFSNNIKLDENVFQTIPSDEVLRAKMIDFIKNNIGDRQLIIVSDEEHEDVKKSLIESFPRAKILTPIENTFIRLDELNPLLSKEKENWVIVETNNIPLLANTSSVLNSAMVEDIKVTMLTTKRGSAYESPNVSNFHLSNLNFHFPTIYKASLADNAFNKEYISKYKKIPNRYVARGYDITMDVILRLAYNKNISSTVRYIGETQYEENKFEYDINAFGGYYNKGVYIVKYENLDIIEVEPSLDKLLAETK